MATATRRAEEPRTSAIRRVTSGNTQAAAGLEVWGLLLTAFSVLLLLSLASFDPRDVMFEYRLRSDQVHNLVGPVGAHIAALLYGTVGVGAFFLVSTFFYFGGLLLAGRRPSLPGGRVMAWVSTLIFASVMFHVVLDGYRPFGAAPGGGVGEWVGEIMRAFFATTGTVIIGMAILAASALTLAGMRIAEAARVPYRAAIWGRARVEAWRRRHEDTDEDASPTEGAVLEVVEGGRQDTKPDKRKPAPPIERASWDADSGREKARENTPVERPKVERSPEPRPPVPARSGEDTPKDTESTSESAPSPSSEKPTPPARKPPVVARNDSSGNIEIARPAPVIDPPTAAIVPQVAEQNSLPLGPKPPYEFPSLSLLDYQPPARQEVNRRALEEAAETLVSKLADFKVMGTVERIQPGPVVTTFEFLPAPGIKISKIEGLSNDLAMALKAKGVRIVAPIPGKGVVGIEVPSAVRETVFLKEILAANEFQESRFKMPMVIGKDIIGNPMVADLAKMPHLLVAGSTGSGKSVAVNAFIMSLVYKHKPKDLRMILVDPKILELSVYDDIPHLLLPVVTEPQKAALALKWAVAEMDRRYRLLAAVGVRNISGFNAKVEKFDSGSKEPPEGVASDELEHLPYIVIVLDELADLMMVAKAEVEQSIARLAQKARAAGIHLIVATQRPSTDVVTGLIKANFPTRMSFMVTQWVDSKTILDRKGAENLLGMGDMLFMPPGTSRLHRCQGCFVSDDDVERVTKHLKKYGPPDYDMDILLDDEEDQKDLSGEDYDAHHDAAVAIVTETRNPSISYLQRRLKIGYNRSARIIERMEFDGVISKPDHRGVRKVLVDAAPGLDEP